MSDVKSEFKDGSYELIADTDQDGVHAAKIKVHLNEALEEILKREKPAEGVKLVGFKMAGTTLSIKLDSDQDGEEVAEIEINLFESFDEASGKFKK